MTSIQRSTRSVTDKYFARRTESGADMDGADRLWASLLESFAPTTARYTRRTGDIYNTASISAFGGVTYEMAVRRLHHDIEAIAHMSDREVINELEVNGLAGVAKRLMYLYDVTEEDEEDIKLDSLRGFAAFMIKNRGMYPPQITVTDDGLIQAVWKHPRQGTLVMDFQESGDVKFTLLYGRWDQGTKRHKLSGELHPDQAMLHVGYFIHKIMGT